MQNYQNIKIGSNLYEKRDRQVGNYSLKFVGGANSGFKIEKMKLGGNFTMSFWFKL
jgi:hypothetical protein